jgi:NAD(P)-dependent dehydrogenase (short-subunit alcohol dehydrogenase family)
MRLKGKTAVVTGGGSGIGLGIAVALSAEGCRVAIAGRRVELLQEVVKTHRGPTPLIAHPVDVSDRESVARLFEWAAKELGPIDLLVNSAGTNVVHRSLADTTPEEWSMLLAANVTGMFHCLQAVLPQMRSRGDGLVINVSSIAGKRALRLGGVAYCASKFAATALGTFATLEEGRHGIRVTNIYPGEVDTPILRHRATPLTAEQLSRILQPEDVGAAAVMIACLPPRAHVAEIVIKPTSQDYS